MFFKTPPKKLNVLMAVFILLSCLVTGYIFYNSTQVPDESNEKSNAISEKIQETLDPEKKIEEEDFHEGTRKAAHVIEFAVLALSVSASFFCYYVKKKKVYVSLPLLICLSVAAVDEFIQSFHERTSCLKDVFIDFGGAGVGFLLFFICVWVYAKRHNKEA